MSSSLFKYVKKYLWNEESTPYHIFPHHLSKQQANKEIFFYSVFEGTLVGLVSFSIFIQVYKTQNTTYLPLMMYGISLLISLYYLVKQKQTWSALYSASLPIIVLLVYNYNGFHPNNTYLDKLLLSGFMALWLIYAHRLFNICRHYKN